MNLTVAIQLMKRNIFLFAFALIAMGSITYAATKTADTTEYSYIHLEESEEFTGTREQAKIELNCPFDSGVLCAEAYVEGEAGNPLMRVPSADIYRN